MARDKDHSHLTGYNTLQHQYEVVMRIFEVINAHLSVEEKVEAIGEALRGLLPFDRFSLGLLWLNRWYTLTEDGLHVTEIRRVEIQDNNYSASKWVVRNRKPLCRPHIREDQRFQYDHDLLHHGLQSDLIIPLVVEDQVVGTFNFVSKKEGTYNKASLETASSVASAVSAVVKMFQDQLFLEGVREISEAVQGSLDLDHVLQMVLDHIQSQGYDRVRVYLYDEPKNELVGVVQAGGYQQGTLKDLRMSLADDVYSQRTFSSRQAQIYRFGELGRGMRDLVDQVFGKLDYPEKAELPLFVVEEGKDRIVGKITLDNGLSERPLLQDRLDALMVYASQAAIAIRHAQLYQSLEKEVEDRTLRFRESEERFRRLAEASFEGVVISEKGIILDVNDLYCEMLDYTRAELLNQPVLSVVAPEYKARVKRYIEIDYEEPYESVMVRKDGALFPIEVRARTVPFEGRMVRVTAIRDISERKMMEQEQIRLERVNAIGELAQGVAHNFNNILVGVLGNAQLIQLRSKDPEVLEDANLIVESALRAKELVKRLQVSIKGDREALSESDVNSAVEAAVDLTRPVWKDESEVRGIVIDVDMQLNDVDPILGDWERLRDVIVNLILNAVEALPDGGKVQIETLMAQEQVQIVFADTGIGMNEEVRRRVFEPFFTTKFNVGSGLGLSFVQGTVKSWGGTAQVESVEGEGSKFVMTFPPCKSEAK